MLVACDEGMDAALLCEYFVLLGSTVLGVLLVAHAMFLAYIMLVVSVDSVFPRVVWFLL